ncbi:MAG: FAD:protein FMN transferase [Haloplanus sp.]
MPDVDRRSLLSVLAGGVLGTGVVGRVTSTADRTEVRSTRPMMGTLVTVTAITDAPERGELGVDAAFAEMERLTDVFSRHDPDAQVARLNDAGTLADPAPELVSVLRTCRRMHDRTDGAFDPTVLPALTETAAHGEGTPDVPGFDRVRIRSDRVRAPAGVTLDGIAKGYIVDRGCAVLREWVDEAMIEAGGDVRVFGGSDGRWRVGVDDPRGDGYLSRIRVRDGAVATSGSYAVFQGSDADRERHRVIRPRTGRSPDEDVCTSVVASTAERADALATAAFAMDDDRAASILDRFDAGGLFLPADGGAMRIGTWE